MKEMAELLTALLLIPGLFITESFEYLLDNALALIVVGLAFGFSKSRMIPLYILIYVSIMTIVTGLNQEYLSWLYDNGMYELYNSASVRAYLFDGVIMLAFGFISFVNHTRLAMLTTVTIVTQALISFITGAVFGVSVELNSDLSLWFDLHYSIQSLFVVLYCLIAWTCVYYSGIRSHEC